jgi:hypothetical protein
MISRAPIDPDRIRRITGSFSWLDHRLISGGFLAAMSQAEILLYFFLVLVGDKKGVSFYSYDKICALLKMDVDTFIRARNQLIDKSMLACDSGRFQVLQLPQKSTNISQSIRGGEFISLK